MPRTKPKFSVNFLIVLLVLFNFHFSLYAPAVNFIWDGSSDNYWDTAANWSNNAGYPGENSEDTATFNGTDSGGTIELNLSPANALIEFIVSSGTYTFQGLQSVDQLSSALFTISGSSTASFASDFINAATGTMQLGDTSVTTLAGAQGIDTIQISDTATLVLDSATLANTSAVSLINDGATIRGDGSIGGDLTLTNASIISPGTDTTIGTISLDGDYSQSSTAVYKLQINPSGATDLIEVGQTATLGGIVNLEPLAGVYEEGTAYTILTAGTLTNTFGSLVESHAKDFTLSYVGSNVILTVDSTTVVSPVALNLLPPNAQKCGTYLYIHPTDVTPNLSEGFLGDVPTANTAAIADLVAIVLGSPASVYADTLMQLTPVQTGAFTLLGLQNNVHMADIMSRRMLHTFGCQKLKSKKSIQKATDSFSNQRQMWVEPIGFYYHQNGRNFFREFDAYTYGIAYGMECPISDIATINGSVGYTHTGIVWSPTLGNAYSNSIYYNLAGGLSSETTFLNLLVQGSVDFYNYTRKIHIPGLKTQTQSSHNSYNLLARLQTGKKYALNQKGDFFLQPEGEFNYLNFFQEGYKEKGSGNTDLSVHYKHSVYFQPNFKMRLIKQFSSSNFCYNPNVYLGWLVDIPVNNSAYESGLYNLYPSHFTFKTESYHFVTNQLVVGGQFAMTNKSAFLFTAGFEADLLSRMSIYALNARCEWSF